MTARERRTISISLSIESIEQLKRVGAAFFEVPQPKEPLPPSTIVNCLANHEFSVVIRLRRRLAEVFEKSAEYRFFEDQYLPGESPNEALLRLFRKRQLYSMTDDQTIELMVKGE
jgi:hypothetical protein